MFFFGAHMRHTRLYPLNPGVTGKPHTGETVGTHLYDAVVDGEADTVVVEDSLVACTDDGSPEFLHKSAKSKHRHFCYLVPSSSPDF
jgi:hypothetical protein